MKVYLAWTDYGEGYIGVYSTIEFANEALDNECECHSDEIAHGDGHRCGITDFNLDDRTE